MSNRNGIVPLVNYATPVGDPAKVQALIDLIPNTDVPPANTPVPSFLDEMSPVAAAQLRVELLALKAAVS